MHLFSALRFLTYALPILVITFAVLMGGAALAWLTGDVMAARIMGGVAVAIVVALVVDIILLVGLLGITAVMNGEADRSRTSSTQRHDVESAPDGQILGRAALGGVSQREPPGD